MSDITVLFDNTRFGGDWSFDGSGCDLQTGDDLVTSVLVSLFTDRLDDQTGQGGWWGDTYRGDLIGSRLWTLRRAKKTTGTLRRAEDYARECLAWMLTDQVAANVAATARWLNGTTLHLTIEITQPGGARTALAFAWAWDAI